MSDEPYDPSAEGEVCRICLPKRVPASHKIEEVTPVWHVLVDDETGLPDYVTMTSERHPFVSYLCCKHFGQILGPYARAWCDAGHMEERQHGRKR